MPRSQRYVPWRGDHPNTPHHVFGRRWLVEDISDGTFEPFSFPTHELAQEYADHLNGTYIEQEDPDDE
jgi:hypothetical protein